MKKEVVLACDIGTSSCKNSLVDVSGSVLDTCYTEYSSIYGRPGYIEQDPADWWQAFVDNTRTLLRRSDVAADRVLAVSVSGITPIVLPVDGRGEPLRNAIIYQDRRCDWECRWLRRNRHAADVEYITTNRIDPSFSLPKIIWLKRHERATFDKAHQYIQSNGYVVLKLTGEFSMDVTHAGLTQLYDMREEKWSSAICDMIGLDARKLPPVYRSYETVGRVVAEAAAATGLVEGTPVVAGCNDTAASSIGVGLIEPGRSFLVIGTAGAVGTCSSVLPTNPALYNYDYLLPKTWFSIAPMAACGASFRWARDRIFRSESEGTGDPSADSYAQMNLMIDSTMPGAGGVVYLPYMAGERSPIWDSTARGVFFGLSLATTRADMLRAIMEGTAFAILDNINVMEHAGMQVKDVVAGGGGAKSHIWNQIIADVTGRAVHAVGSEETVNLGDAIVAFYGLKMLDDGTLAERVGQLIQVRESFHPDPKRKDLYAKLFELYKGLYRHLKSDFRTLSDIACTNSEEGIGQSSRG